jgi:hypothetical protein
MKVNIRTDDGARSRLLASSPTAMSRGGDWPLIASERASFLNGQIETAHALLDIVSLSLDIVSLSLPKSSNFGFQLR